MWTNRSTYRIFRQLARLPCMEHHGLELKDVFLPLYYLILVTELLGKSSTAINVFWRHEVDCDLDAVGEITNLF